MKKRIRTLLRGAPLVAVAAVFVFNGAGAFAQSSTLIALIKLDIRDYCDPDSFNAAVGPGTCIRSTALGDITFPGFVAELTADQSAGAWRFVPSQVAAAQGATMQVHNLGGETHTFTQVKEFGGGFIDFLNGLSGNPTPAPECAQVVNGQLVPQPPGPDNIFLNPGDTVTVPLDHEVNARYQCCIHPWMRLTITPRDEHHTQVP